VINDFGTDADPLHYLMGSCCGDQKDRETSRAVWCFSGDCFSGSGNTLNAAVDTILSQAPADEGDIACTIARNSLFWRAWLVYIVARSNASYSENVF